MVKCAACGAQVVELVTHPQRPQHGGELARHRPLRPADVELHVLLALGRRRDRVRAQQRLARLLGVRQAQHQELARLEVRDALLELEAEQRQRVGQILAVEDGRLQRGLAHGLGG